MENKRWIKVLFLEVDSILADLPPSVHQAEVINTNGGQVGMQPVSCSPQPSPTAGGLRCVMPTSGMVALGEAVLSFLAAPCGGGGGDDCRREQVSWLVFLLSLTLRTPRPPRSLPLWHFVEDESHWRTVCKMVLIKITWVKYRAYSRSLTDVRFTFC